QLRVRIALAVEERERARRRLQGRLDDVAWEQHPSSGMVEGQAVLEEAALHLRAADLHPDLGEDALRLIDDADDQLIVEDPQARPHPPSTRVSVSCRRRREDGIETLDHAADCQRGNFYCLS